MAEPKIDHMIIDICLDEALVLEIDDSLEICADCFFQSSMKDSGYNKYKSACRNFACNADNRADGKNVIFKLVDYPPKEKE